MRQFFKSAERTIELGGNGHMSPSLHPVLPVPAFAAKPASRPRTLVCFSHLRWGFIWQRPQHLLSRATAQFNVIVVEELVATTTGARLDLSHPQPNVTVAVPHVPEGTRPEDAAAMQETLLDRLLADVPTEDRVFWYYTPAFLPFTDRLACGVTVFDNMDDLTSFKGASPALAELESQMLQRADVVFTGGLSLYEAKAGRHSNIHAFPSSIETDHFRTARLNRATPRIGPPRLGFFGVIDERLDVDLLDAVAAQRPDWRIVMVGPVVKIDPATLPRRPNIDWCGQVAYADLPKILAEWDVGIMPFAINAATRFISPTKTPEFLAAGLPVVSTPVLDVVRSYGQHGLVEIASTAGSFVTAAEQHLTGIAPDWLARVDAHLARSSWDSTWAAMRNLIEQVPTHVAAISGTRTAGAISFEAAE